MTDNHPTYSIVIPTYNNVQLFRRALNSVLAQTYSDWEIVITDDSTSDVIETDCRDRNDSRIKYFRRNVRDGAVNNWNNGLFLAKGEYVIVMHHDEEFVSQVYLERLASLLENNDIVVCDIRVFTPGQPERRGRVNGWIKHIMLRIPSTILIVNPIGPCACIAFHRSIMQMFDEHLTWLVDTEWYYRMLKCARRITFEPHLLIRSNSGHADQITQNINIEEKDRCDTVYLTHKYEDNFGIRTALRLKIFTSQLRKLIRR